MVGELNFFVDDNFKSLSGFVERMLEHASKGELVEDYYQGYLFNSKTIADCCGFWRGAGDSLYKCARNIYDIVGGFDGIQELVNEISVKSRDVLDEKFMQAFNKELIRVAHFGSNTLDLIDFGLELDKLEDALTVVKMLNDGKAISDVYKDGMEPETVDIASRLCDRGNEFKEYCNLIKHGQSIVDLKYKDDFQKIAMSAVGSDNKKYELNMCLSVVDALNRGVDCQKVLSSVETLCPDRQTQARILVNAEKLCERGTEMREHIEIKAKQDLLSVLANQNLDEKYIANWESFVQKADLSTMQHINACEDILEIARALNCGLSYEEVDKIMERMGYNGRNQQYENIVLGGVQYFCDRGKGYLDHVKERDRDDVVHRTQD